MCTSTDDQNIEENPQCTQWNSIQECINCEPNHLLLDGKCL